MASEFYGYFDSIDGDVREYDAAGFSHILKAAVQNGVSSHEGALAVTADGLGMQTTVAFGGCVIDGYVFVLEDDGGGAFSLTHEPSGTADRIDRVVVRLESGQSERRMGLALLTGTPSASPQPPALTRSAQVWELSLAQVRVRASATAVAASDVTDERGDEDVCGYAQPRHLAEVVRQGMAGKLDISRLANNLTTTGSGWALDARQGKALKDEVDKKLPSANLANNLTTTAQGYALDARQGKALNSAIAAKASKTTATASLSTSGWSGEGPYTQAVSVSGVTASNAVVVSPAPASFAEYGACGVYASAQAAGKLTFTATARPAAALTVNVLCVN